MQCVLNGVKVNYEYIKNEKTTILFLHGWGGGLSSFKAAFNYFDKLNYSVLNLDLPPFGESGNPLENFDIYSYYNLVLELLKKLNITKVNVVAHSFGGRIAILLASKNSRLIESLTLTSAAGIKPKKSIVTRFKIINYKLKKKFIKNKNLLKKYGSRDYKNLSPLMKKVFVKVVNENLTKYLKTIKTKTLIVWAKDDLETPLYMAKKLNKKIENSGLYLFDSGGHFCYLKHHNQFVKAIEYLIEN